jgi:excinuclease ABC subunit B
MFDVLVGINLLREGLDLPEVSLVAILDADKEGYLRSYRSLVQTAGRAARHERGRAIFYGDVITESMRLAIDETARRRRIQADFNRAHGIVPSSIKKEIHALDYADSLTEPLPLNLAAEGQAGYGAEESIEAMIRELEREMKAAAKVLEFEKAAALRNRIRDLKLREFELKSER